jgi:hypothetical protein
MRTSSWLGLLNRCRVVPLLLAAAWANGCKSGLGTAQAHDAALGSGGDTSQLGGVVGTGGASSGGAGGTTAAPDADACAGIPIPDAACPHGSPTVLCVAGPGSGTWQLTCPAPPDGANPTWNDSASTGGGAGGRATGGTGGATGSGGSGAATGSGGSGGATGSGGSTMRGSGGTNAGSGGATAGPSGDAGPDAATLPAGQKYLFEIHRANFAWSAVHYDYYITADGNLYRAEQPDAGTTAISGYSHDMTEEQITAHHGSAVTLVTTVAPDVLRAKVDLISYARQGELLTVGACADYGTVDYIGFDYTPGTGRYDAIPLGTDGDRARQNTAPEAQALVDWLAGGVLATKRQCTFSESCGAFSSCKVADCSACAGFKLACIVDKLNQPYCGPSGTCTADLTCACLGDSVCAGGASLCTGTAASGFGCAPR